MGRAYELQRLFASRRMPSLPIAHARERLGLELPCLVQIHTSPGTVRSWIQSGALRSSRPGNGAQPGRTYRIRREDLDTFVAASEGRLALSGGPSAMPPCSVRKSDGSPRGGDEVT